VDGCPRGTQVQGSGFGVWDLGLRVQGSGSRLGLGRRVQCSGSKDHHRSQEPDAHGDWWEG
jgi:hypothetical protein